SHDSTRPAENPRRPLATTRVARRATGPARCNHPVVAPKPDLPVLEVPGKDAFEHWLEQNHASSNGVWLRIAKKGSPTSTVSHSQALEVALCFGGIDGQARPDNEHFWFVRFTPGHPQSKRSQPNRASAEPLI